MSLVYRLSINPAGTYLSTNDDPASVSSRLLLSQLGATAGSVDAAIRRWEASPGHADNLRLPSATLAMLRALSGVLMPKPTMTGRLVDCLIRATSGPTSAA